MNAAAPNVAHALDASHAIRTINDAVANGINNIALVHDSFACLAPGATRLHQILRSKFVALYAPIPFRLVASEQSVPSTMSPISGAVSGCTCWPAARYPRARGGQCRAPADPA